MRLCSVCRKLGTPRESKKTPDKAVLPDIRTSRGKSKAISVTGRGSLQDCETSRLPHFYRQSAYRWQCGFQPYTLAAL
jgi:hypothetical protein